MKTNTDRSIPDRAKTPGIGVWMRKHVVSCIRTLSRILFFIAFPSLYIMAYFGLVDVLVLLRDGTFSVDTAWVSLISLFAILPVTIIGGRFFCGFMCAFGALTDLIYHIGYRIMRKKFRIPKRLDAISRYAKYLILLLLLLLTWADVSVAEYSPWDAFHNRRYSEFFARFSSRISGDHPLDPDPCCVTVHRAFLLPLPLPDRQRVCGSVRRQTCPDRETERSLWEMSDLFTGLSYGYRSFLCGCGQKC